MVTSIAVIKEKLEVFQSHREIIEIICLNLLREVHFMKNDDSYKRIPISSLDISSRIKQLADEKHIYSLYELIQYMDSLNNNTDHTLENNDADEWLNNIIVLNDEFGNEVLFEFLDLIEYDNEEYVILLPVSEDNDSGKNDGEVVILKVTDEGSGDTEEYVSVDSEETLSIVFNIFKEKFIDVFNFE